MFYIVKDGGYVPEIRLSNHSQNYQLLGTAGKPPHPRRLCYIGGNPLVYRPDTMLELATLGLLRREPLHGYRLTKLLELFMGSCISVNYGAIYPLLRRLEQRGHISSLSIQKGEAGPSRVIYQITPQGRERWLALMLEKHRESWVNSRARFMVLLCFFGDLTQEQRLLLLGHRLEQCQTRLTHLQAEETQGLFADHYQRMALERAVAMVQDELDWVQELLQRESTHEPVALQVQG
ncbi:helix-turn-helix transcriptional regulator [Gloeomargaritales cyanobacterium VI4D9]|nr:helix-turn-helix transcriptional regulator [Gloeomargaritales cyanobacterium VI4D9]